MKDSHEKKDVGWGKYVGRPNESINREKSRTEKSINFIENSCRYEKLLISTFTNFSALGHFLSY